MSNETGTFRTDVEIENPARPGERRQVSGVLVDTGAELSWIPAEVLESLGIKRFKLWRFRQADGTARERWAGAALMYASGPSPSMRSSSASRATWSFSARDHWRGSIFWWMHTGRCSWMRGLRRPA